MSDLTQGAAELRDLELQELATEWRLRAMRGDQLAARIARSLEAEQRRRIRDTGLQPIAPACAPVASPWWKFW